MPEESSNSEKKIQKLETTLETVEKLMSFGTWELDLLTMTRYWSDEVFDLLEFDPDKREYITDPLSFYAPESRDTAKELMGRAITEGKPWDTELKIITAKGNPLWVRACGEVILEDGKPVKLFGIIQDINKRKTAEENL